MSTDPTNAKTEHLSESEETIRLELGMLKMRLGLIESRKPWFVNITAGITLLAVLGFAYYLGSLNQSVNSVSTKLDKISSSVSESSDSLLTRTSVIETKLGQVEAELGQVKAELGQVEAELGRMNKVLMNIDGKLTARKR